MEQNCIEAKREQFDAIHADTSALTLKSFSAYAELVDWDFWFYLILTPLLYGLAIPVFDQLYSTMAIRLNGWENHKTESNYQTHLILK